MKPAIWRKYNPLKPITFTPGLITVRSVGRWGSGPWLLLSIPLHLLRLAPPCFLGTGSTPGVCLIFPHVISCQSFGILNQLLQGGQPACGLTWFLMNFHLIHDGPGKIQWKQGRHSWKLGLSVKKVPVQEVCECKKFLTCRPFPQPACARKPEKSAG